MDENHYNFIKRSHKATAKKPQDSRAILNKIENFERTQVRPNTVDADRIMRLKKTKREDTVCIQEPVERYGHAEDPTNRHTTGRIKRVRSRKIQPRRTSLESSVNESPLIAKPAKNQNTSPNTATEVQKWGYTTPIDKQKNAVDSLCRLSSNENNGQEAQHYLSRWTNSYPLKQTRKKRETSILPVNRSSSCYSTQQRYRISRPAATSPMQCITENFFERGCNNRSGFDQLRSTICRTASHSHPEPPPQPAAETSQDDIQNHFASKIFEEKVIFFRNGIINQLRRKQQMGRQAVLEQWRQLNQPTQGQHFSDRI